MLLELEQVFVVLALKHLTFGDCSSAALLAVIETVLVAIVVALVIAVAAELVMN